MGASMKASIIQNDNINGTLVLGIYEGTTEVANDAGMEKALKARIDSILQSGDFKAKADSALPVIGGPEGNALLLGLGKDDKADLSTYRNAGAKLVSSKKYLGNTFTVRLPSESSGDLLAFVEGCYLRDYKYDEYLSKDEDDDDQEDINVYIYAGEKSGSLDSEIKTIEGVTKGVFTSRDLGNCPPNDMYPMAYAERAREMAKAYDNLTVEVINYEEALSQGMGGLIGVGKGSARKPCMVFFKLNYDTTSGKAPTIVGKGITFDTGGISLKPGQNMDEMKYDMGGSTVVFGLMQALAETGYEGRVTGIACMAENMPSADATRPGDVLTSYSGKTIEVLNTDAEGRLVLADGLWKAGELSPEYIIDLATLTGACVIALGHEATGLWSNNDDLRQRIHDSGNEVGELAWPMPLLPAFEKQMTSSKIADVKNLGERWGGANTAAAFLKQFVPEGEDGEQIPWAHMDIAGTFWGAKTNKMVAHGATGVHVRTLHNLITKN